MRAAVVPDWLAELVRPKPAPLPWPDMIRTALAICVPLGVAFAVGKTTIGLLPAVGGLLGSLTDRGGSYLNRVKRISAVGVFGGAAGLAIGSAIHGRGWIAVVALVVVAGVSAVLSTVGDIGSQVGLQLLVYTSLGIGPFGALRPVWHTAAGFLVGVVWALVLILPGWLLAPYGQDQRYVAAVYQALADQLAAIGTDVLHGQTAGRDHRGQRRLRRTAQRPGHRGGPEPDDHAPDRGAEREQPDVAGGDHARGGREPAAADGHRDGAAAGRGDQDRGQGVPAADDPAGLGHQLGGGGAARRDGRRGPGAGPGLDARGPDAGRAARRSTARRGAKRSAIPRTGSGSGSSGWSAGARSAAPSPSG